MPSPPAALPPRHRRRWYRPRISLRALMILVAVVAVPAGWVASTIRTQRRAIEAVRGAGGILRFDFQSQDRPLAARRRMPPSAPPPGPEAPRWLRDRLGDELFQAVRRATLPSPASGSVLAALGDFAQLERLDLHGTIAAPGWADHLRGLRRLVEVHLDGVDLAEADFTEVARLPAVRTLEVNRTLMADAGFLRLAAHPTLARLTITDCTRLTDAGAARLLAGLPGLRSFRWINGPASLAHSLAALVRHHPDLESLELARCGVLASDLDLLGKLPHLRSLTLREVPITGGDLARLRAPASLRRLELTLPGLADESLAGCASAPSLRELVLNETDVTGAGLARLAPLTTLTRLNLADSRLADADLRALAPLTHLDHLTLSRARRITGAGLAALRPLRDLRRLDLDETRLADPGLAPLHALINLRSLDLRATSVTPAGVAALRRALPALEIGTPY